jgi:Ca2+-binding RTX toxin-like protein
MSVNTNFTELDTTTNVTTQTNGTPYSGPVASLQWQDGHITCDNLNITASVPNVFMHSGSGEDALQALSGINVMDGGTGCNFLVGGDGTDTFFVDDRNATSDIWSTMVNFHVGDAATVWGVTPQDFQLNWADNEGAAGFTGLTLHATSAGKPTASLTLPGYTTTDLNNGRLTVSFGNDPVSGSNYMYVHGNS